MSTGVSLNRFGWLMAAWFSTVSRVDAANDYIHPVLDDDANTGTTENRILALPDLGAIKLPENINASDK